MTRWRSELNSCGATGRNGIRAVGQFAIERDNSVPATVKSQVAAEAEDAIPDRAIAGNEAQCPHLRVKYTIRVRCVHVVNARLHREVRQSARNPANSH
jgi:hypothetical protein